MDSFFFRELQLIAVLLLIRDSYMSWTIWFIPLKVSVGFSIFDSVSFLSNVLVKFLFSIDSLTLKRHNSFQNKHNKKASHNFAPRPLILSCNKKFQNSMVSTLLELSKNWPRDKFFKLRNSKLWKHRFFQ